MTAPLPLRHLLLAVAVVVVWGTNFVVVKLALAQLPPLFMACLRFCLVLVPAVFFLKRPAVSWANLAAYGVCIGAGQFGLLFIALDGHISPGLASLVIQTQVFFTIGMAMFAAGERLELVQWIGLLLGASGLATIGVQADSSSSLLGLILVLGAAFCWAAGNMASRRAGRVDMLAYVVWASAFSIPPLLTLSLVLEGPQRIALSVGRADAVAWAAVLWQVLGNTLFGYAAWGWLLARHPAGTVMPVALFVPVFGLASSSWWLDEPLPLWKLAAAGLVLCGLALNLLWPLLRPAQVNRPSV